MRSRHQGSAHHAGARQPQRTARPAYFPGEGGRLQSARLPLLRHRPIVAEARQVRRLHRLLELSGMQIHPHARRHRCREPSATGDRPGVKVLGDDPETGEEITLRDGRFGTYVQQGEGEKPKRSSLPKNIAPADVTLEQAIGASQPATQVALHPETQSADSRRHRPLRALCPARQDLCQYRQGRRHSDDRRQPRDRSHRRQGERSFGPPLRRAASSASRALGEHPEGGAVVIKAGRFGPYVNWGKINATLPRDADPTSVDARRGGGAARRQGARGSGGAQGRVLGAASLGRRRSSLREGRFGPYVSHGKINATLKNGLTPETISLEDAIRSDRGQGPACPAQAARRRAAKAKPAPQSRSESGAARKHRRRQSAAETDNQGAGTKGQKRK